MSNSDHTTSDSSIDTNTPAESESTLVETTPGDQNVVQTEIMPSGSQETVSDSSQNSPITFETPLPSSQQVSVVPTPGAVSDLKPEQTDNTEQNASQDPEKVEVVS